MNSAGDTIRLVIISLPPPDLLGPLESLRAECCQVGNSRAALAWPVHVTLRTGALVPRDGMDAFLDGFGQVCAGITPFRIRLSRFVADRLPAGNGQGAGGCFAGFEVELDEGFRRGHAQLLDFGLYRKGPQSHFQPHLTLAFDDLDEQGLVAIRNLAATKPHLPVGAEWLCTRAELYRLESGAWHRTGSLTFNGSSTMF